MGCFFVLCIYYKSALEIDKDIEKFYNKLKHDYLPEDKRYMILLEVPNSVSIASSKTAVQLDQWLYNNETTNVSNQPYKYNYPIIIYTREK